MSLNKCPPYKLLLFLTCRTRVPSRGAALKIPLDRHETHMYACMTRNFYEYVYTESSGPLQSCDAAQLLNHLRAIAHDHDIMKLRPTY